jgi:AbiV family abortive infection protein
MENLSIEDLCRGMLAVRANAFEFLEDARLLRRSGRISRAFALAYMACEEVGKLPIMLGVATKLALGVPVNWKQATKRFHSHSSKASQFFGLARAMPMLLEAVASGQKTVNREEVMQKAALGVLIGPDLFGSRNASVYCDFVNGKFVAPAEQINEEMADTMLQYAETNVSAASSILNGTAEAAAATIRTRASRERYEENQVRASQILDEVLAAITSGKGKDIARDNDE